MRLILALISLLFLTAASQAGETPWQQIAPGVSARLISSGEMDAEGRTLIGLELDMPATTKTYWRVPGETGIPTEIDLAGSMGIGGHQVLWPYPQIDQASGYLDYVYFGPTVLPIEIDLDADTARLDLAAVLGICSDICVPAEAEFSMPLGTENPDRANGLRVRQAVARAPVPWPEQTAMLGDAWYDADRHAVVLDLAPTATMPDSLIGALENGEPLLGPGEVDPAAHRLLLPVMGKAEPEDLVGRLLDLVFTTDRGAFSLTRTIGGD